MCRSITIRCMRSTFVQNPEKESFRPVTQSKVYLVENSHYNCQSYLFIITRCNVTSWYQSQVCSRVRMNVHPSQITPDSCPVTIVPAIIMPSKCTAWMNVSEGRDELPVNVVAGGGTSTTRLLVIHRYCRWTRSGWVRQDVCETVRKNQQG